MTEYPLVSIAKIAPGAVTATEVRSGQGRFLFPPGRTLSVKDIQKCKAWGVWHLRVENNPAEAEPKCGTSREEIKKTRDALLPYFTTWDFQEAANREVFKNIVLWTADPENNPLEPVAGQDMDPEPLSKALERPDLNRLIHKDENLATLPDIFSRLMAAVNDPKCTSHHLARILGNDPGLCAKVLRLVNSPVYGLMRKIETMERAVTLVGINEISKIALSISVMSMFRDIPAKVMDMHKFWSHCIGCGLVAEILAEEKNIPPDRYLIAGMLHDIGRLIMLKNHPRAALYAIKQAREKRIPLHAMENEVWGFTHCQVGAKILELWSLPEFLVQAARFHHRFEKSDYRLEIGIVQLADSLVQALFMGYSGNQFIPSVPPRIWETLGLSPGIIPTVFTQTRYRAVEMIDTLL